MSRVILEFQGKTRAIELEPGETTFGRSSKCTVALEDPNLSREHCVIRVTSHGVLVEDLGSRNGTYVNGERIREHRLQKGDEIRLGTACIHFEAKRGATERRRTRLRTGGPLVPDFRVWVHSPRAGRWATGAVAVLLALGLAVAAFVLLRPEPPPTDGGPPSLLRENPSFEAGTSGWTLVGGIRSRISASAEPAHHGRGSLALDKDAGEAMVEVAGSPVDLSAVGGALEFTGWALSAGFQGYVGWKVVWKRGDSPLRDTWGPAARPGADWTAFRLRARIPRECTGAAVSLYAIGSAGTVKLDDLAVVSSEFEESPVQDLPPYRVQVGPGGIEEVAWQGIPLVSGWTEGLVLQAGGAVPLVPASADRPQVVAGGGRLMVRSRAVDPVGLGLVDLEQTLELADGELRASIARPGIEGASRELWLAVILPGARGANEPPASVLFDREGRRWALHASEAGRVDPVATSDAAAAFVSTRVRASWSWPSLEPTLPAQVAVGPIETADLRRAAELLRQAQAAEQGGALGQAADVYGRMAGTGPAARLAAIRAEAEADQTERDSAFRWAEITAAPEDVSRAEEAQRVFAAKFEGETFQEAIGAGEARLASLASAGAGDPPRARALLEEAKAAAERGEPVVQRHLVDALLAQYPGTEAAREAEALRGGP